MKFKKGKTIIHLRQGACQVRKVLAKKIVLRRCFNKGSRLTIFIPKKSIDKIGLRPLNTKKYTLRALKNLNVKVRVQQMKHSKEKIREWFEKGDLKRLSRVVTELYKKIHLDEDSRISQKKLLRKAVNFLAEEVAAVEGIEKKEARQKILARLKCTFGC